MCKFNKELKNELVEALGLTEEQLELLDESKFDDLLTQAIKKNLDQSEQSETESQTEKETEMNVVNAIETPVVETPAETTIASTTLAKVKSPAARKAISIFAKVAAGVLFGGACAVAGAAHHKEVNKTIKKARKKVGKVIPALAPKPWYKF
jgi:hypothetical protein